MKEKQRCKNKIPVILEFFFKVLNDLEKGNEVESPQKKKTKKVIDPTTQIKN